MQHFKIRWALIRGGRLKEGGRLIEEIRYVYFVCVCMYAYEHKFIMAEIMRMRMFKMLLTSA